MMPVAGSLNTPCTLAVRTVTGKNAAGVDKIDFVDQSGTVWIALRQPKADEVPEHDSETTRITWIAYTHFRDDLRSNARLTSGSRIFFVQGEPVDPFGERKELTLTLVEDLA